MKLRETREREREGELMPWSWRVMVKPVKPSGQKEMKFHGHPGPFSWCKYDSDQVSRRSTLSML
jgi:hypothetical protein